MDPTSPIDASSALAVAEFARNISGELHTVRSSAVENAKKIAPVDLNRTALIASLTNQPETIQSIDDPAAIEAQILQREATRETPFTLPIIPSPSSGVQGEEFPSQQRGSSGQPRPAYRTSVMPSSQAPVIVQGNNESQLNAIMLSIVSIEQQLAMIHKLLKPKPSTRKKQKQ